MPSLLSLLVPAAAALAIRAEHMGQRRWGYVFKPLATTLILLVALGATQPLSPSYRAAIALGLLFSLAGDVFLMLPSDRFVAGLVSFLVAHLCYIAAFSPFTIARPLALVVLLAHGLALLWMLWPRLGRLRVPVAVYAAVLLVMAWQAIAFWGRSLTLPALLAASGAVLFVVSDSVLALERFLGRHRYGRVVVLGTYFAAQWLIALSVNAPTP